MIVKADLEKNLAELENMQLTYKLSYEKHQNSATECLNKFNELKGAIEATKGMIAQFDSDTTKESNSSNSINNKNQRKMGSTKPGPKRPENEGSKKAPKKKATKKASKKGAKKK